MTAGWLSAQAEADSNYVIGEEDVLSVIVRNEPDFTAKERIVRMDGRISLPILGEIYVVGKTTGQLEEELAIRLEQYLRPPIVITVNIEKVQSHKVVVAGNVGKPGHYAIGTPSTVIDILVRAGSPTPTAKVKKIKIVRKINGVEVQFSFNYKDVIEGKNMSQNILLENGDYILVP
jgi:polysaccharide export outer membrane protein